MQTSMLTVLEFPTFQKDAEDLFAATELDDLRTLLAYFPESGDKIPGMRGIRKLRVGLKRAGKGKRGGARVVYFYYNASMPLALIAVYAKGEKIDLPASEKKELCAVVDAYVAHFLKRSNSTVA